jgi:hypothetical protein
MTMFLLILTEDGHDSYSLWKTEQSARLERRHLVTKFGLSIDQFDIIPVDVFD